MTSISDLAMLVKGFRVSSAFAEGMAKMVFSLTGPVMQRTFQECVTQLGGVVRAGMAPRSHTERILQLALDDLEL